MTQAFNLALLANAVDTSGRLNVGTNATGTLPIANGGTGTTTPSLVQGTGITITGSWPNQTINATGTGTVTSVATGNGLSGGTITTTGTLAIACPSFGSVGSYTMFAKTYTGSNVGATEGSTISGLNTARLQNSSFDAPYSSTTPFTYQGAGSALSGSWRVMSGTSLSPSGSNNNNVNSGGLACRIS